MSPKFMKIDELKAIIIKHTRKLDKNEYAKKCTDQFNKSFPVFKDTQISKEAMTEGNLLYRQNNLDFAQLYKILTLYNESIAIAPRDSKELTSAYANKTAVLQRMRKYQECITEIDKVLKMTESLALKVKMLCRKAECLTAIGSPESRRCLEKAKFAMAKFEESEKESSTLNKLIQKTQRVIEEGKLDVPKEDKRKMQALKLIEDIEKIDPQELVRVEYSKNYGRHLVAARDFKPGEIILVEKPYFNSLDDPMVHQYCDHCFDQLWTAVTCDYCARRLFCSEKCRAEAWDEYHEMDCLALACMRVPFHPDWTPRLPLLVGIFCKALKEAGSVEQMLADLESSSQCEDENGGREIFMSTDFTSYKSFFTLNIRNIEKANWEFCIKNCIAALVGLAKYTKILGKTYDFKDIDKLMRDNKAILIGSLLLKFELVFNGVLPLVELIDPNRPHDHCGRDASKFKGPYNHSYPLATMHTLGGCIPNVDSYPAHGNKFVICALQHIKAGDQLTSNLQSILPWSEATKFERQCSYRRLYNCPCECPACTENWSNILDDLTDLQNSISLELQNPVTLKLWEERNSIISDWQANRHKLSCPDIKIVSRIANLVDTVGKQFPLPSPIMFRSVMMLMRALRDFYDPMGMHPKIPSLRRGLDLENTLDISKILSKAREPNNVTECQSDPHAL